MTAVQSPVELEAYAARALREGRFADAAAALSEAAANNPSQTLAQQKQATADASSAAAAVLSSHVASGYPLPQMSFMNGAGTFALTGTITQTWVGGTTARMAGAGRFTSAT